MKATGGEARKAAWDAARDAEEIAWRAYVDVRTGADVEAAEAALVAYDASMAVTDEARDAYFAARKGSTPA